MTLVAFLRGVNVGGHRTFQPSVLATKLARYDVVNIGAAGTFVVRKPGTRAAFGAALRSELPFETHIVLCDAREVLRFHAANPFGDRHAPRDIVRFVSVLSKRSGALATLPCQLPANGRWFVRIVGAKHPFVFGEYRRHMKTIGYLGQIDKLFATPVTTRNWNTIGRIVEILSSPTDVSRGRVSPRRRRA